MILGISLLLVSVSFLVYRHPLSSWRFWLHQQATPLPLAPADKDQKKDRTQKSQSQNDTNEYATASRGHGDGVSEEYSRPAKRVQVVLPDDEPSPSTTPRAETSDGSTVVDIPTLSLNTEVSSEEEDDAPPPQFPALNSAQRASSTVSPPAIPSSLKPQRSINSPVSASLMPPPPLPPRIANSRLAPSVASSLRVPASSPLPNRAPPASSSLAIPLSAPIKAPNPRQKVQLKPGYSPLDWAHLLKSEKNLSGVTSLQRVTPSQLKQNNGRKGRPAWSSYQGKVYNIAPYLPYHPGGEGELRRAAGKDGEKLFTEVHPWVNWENMLGPCLVGIIVGENEGPATSWTVLDEMD